MKLSIAYLVAICAGLAACSSTSVAVKRNFPDAVPQLLQSCPPLQLVNTSDNVPITELITVIIENYALYYECAVKNDAWKQWYEQQRKLFQDVNE
jgi:hypothetical protein